MSFKDLNFVSIPNFKFKEIISEKSEGYGTSSLFEIYKDKNNNTFLFSPFFNIKNPYSNKSHISVISLKDNQEKHKLEGHISRIKSIRYFMNPQNKKEYLISVDTKYKIIVWDLNNNYSKIFEKIINYKNIINDILMIFINNKTFIVTSAITSENYTKVININDDNEIFEIKNSFGLYIFNLSYWHNKKNDNHYIIQCGKCKVLISEYQNKEDYAIIETNEKYPNNLGSVVYSRNNKDYLAFSSTFGLIIIYDLLNKVQIEKFILNNSFLVNIVKWNEKYLLTIDVNKKRILIISLDIYKIVCSIVIPQIFSHERYVKKLIHPLYGESLISIGNDYKIKLYVNNFFDKK